jgi:flagellar biosynthetic protein FliP
MAALAGGAGLAPSSVARAQATAGEGSDAPPGALAQAAPSAQPAPTVPAPTAPAPATPAARSGSATRPAAPAVSIPIPPKVDVRVGEGENALHLTGTVGLVVLIGLMTLLPALFLLMTSFTRILIVLQFLRPALGTQSAPPAQLLAALAVLLTGVVMNPTLQQANQAAVQPFLRGEITQVQAYQEGLVPFREFMLANTRDKDLALFTELSGVDGAASYDEVPTLTLVSAFVTSELRTAFQMGFLIFLPFVILDVIVASVLMSLGMFMLPPMMVSMPFKLLLFVIADGWGLVVQNLVQSFRH